MSPEHKKPLVQAAVGGGLCDGRAGWRILRLARAPWWDQAGVRSDAQQPLVARLHARSDAHPRYG